MINRFFVNIYVLSDLLLGGSLLVTKSTGFGMRDESIGIHGLFPTGGMTLGKLLDLSELPFPHL